SDESKSKVSNDFVLTVREDDIVFCAIWKKASSGSSDQSSADSGQTSQKTVILANGTAYPDTLTASVLANLKNAPVLLSNFENVNTTTLNEIKRLGATEIIIVGGNQVVSESVVSQLEKEISGVKVSRIWGKDRYKTSIKVGEEVRKLISESQSLASLRTNLNTTSKSMTNSSSETMSNATSRSMINLSPRIVSNSNLRSMSNSTLTNAESSQNLLDTKNLDSVSAKGTTNQNSVILAVGTNFPDAMSVTSLAEYTNTPILLTQTETLNQDTENILKTWGITNVTIIGKEKAISTNVEDMIKNLSTSADVENSSVSSISVDRIGGEDRYETAKLIGDKLISILGNEETSNSRTSSNIDNLSNELNESSTKDTFNRTSLDNILTDSTRTSSNEVSQAILVDGTNFPDALTVSSLSGYYKVPVLLTQREFLNNTTQKALKGWSVSKITIAGGTNAVAKEIEEELKGLKENSSSEMTIERLAGVDRYETAVQISQKYSRVNKV
ncbi:MAG: cell wall-binding repeat-containing protein, partial [Clostridioides sp.]|nr:cell wall-binding repeat-containing protein [Clostridioides sp.]